MTVTPIAPAPTTARQQRPWTDETLAELVAAIRSGDDVPQLAARFGRTPQGTYPRLRLLLPVDERKCPTDRVLPRLREHLADESYDWKDALLRTPPPVPVVRHEVQGLPGLAHHDLVALTVAAHNAPGTDAGLLEELRAECRRRGVEFEVRQLLKQALTDGRVNASDEHLSAMVGAWWSGEARYLGSTRQGGYGDEPGWY